MRPYTLWEPGADRFPELLLLVLGDEGSTAHAVPARRLGTICTRGSLSRLVLPAC